MSVPTRSRPRRLRARLLAHAAFCALLVSARPAPEIRPLQNGDFENGLAGWLVEPTQTAVGSASAAATASVGDSGSFIGTVHPLALTIFAAAEGSSGPSTAHAGMRLRQPGLVAGRFLDFQAGGGWGIGSFGGASLKHRAAVVVRGTGPAQGLEAAFVLGRNESLAGAPCSTGFFADFGAFPMKRSIDLAAAGFHIGDPVEIEIAWQAQVRADEPCQQAEIIGTLYFDDLAFRN